MLLPSELQVATQSVLEADGTAQSTLLLLLLHEPNRLGNENENAQRKERETGEKRERGRERDILHIGLMDD